MAPPNERNVEVKISFKTLTPLWTGGADGQMNRICESGLLGSMRWWYEAIVRALGGKACDPSGGKKCLYDATKHKKSTISDERQALRRAGLCDVCQLFGATGWRRRFQLQVVEDETRAIWQGNTLLNIRPGGRNRGWYLPPGRLGTFSLQLRTSPYHLTQVLALLRFIAQYGTLGAKPQLGYGVVEILNNEEVKQHTTSFSWKNLLPENTGQAQTPEEQEDLPNLKDMGFFCYRFEPEHSSWWVRLSGLERVVRSVQPFARQTVPIAPLLKNTWRFGHWQRHWGRDRDFWGLVETERQRGKVTVSWAYRTDEAWEIRGSTWLCGLKDEKAVWAMFQNAEIWANTVGIEGDLITTPREQWKKILDI